MLLPMGIVTNRVYYELLNENSVALLLAVEKQSDKTSVWKKFCEGFSWHLFGDFFLAAIFRDPTQDQTVTMWQGKDMVPT